MKYSRILLFLICSIVFLPPSNAAEKPATADPASTQKNAPVPELSDITRGSDDALVTLVEYSSVNCVHCAHFRKNELKKIIKRFVDTGKVKLIYRHFPLDYTAVEAMSLIAKQPKEKWNQLLDVAYATQGKWLGEKPEKLGEVLGLSKEQCQAALKCDKVKELIMAKRFNAEAKIQIDATPTFHILYKSGKEQKDVLINYPIAEGGLTQLLETLVAALEEDPSATVEIQTKSGSKTS